MFLFQSYVQRTQHKVCHTQGPVPCSDFSSCPRTWTPGDRLDEEKIWTVLGEVRFRERGDARVVEYVIVRDEQRGVRRRPWDVQPMQPYST